MPENMDKWASGNRKIAKSGHRVAAEMIPFPRRWHGSMISADPVAIWGMSGNSECSKFGFGAVEFALALDSIGAFIAEDAPICSIPTWPAPLNRIQLLS